MRSLLNMSWDIWLNILSSTVVGHSLSHGRLACRQQQHRFWHNRQTLTMKCYRFSFITSPLAEFSDCGLIRLQLLVLSHITPCECHMCPYYRTISCFSLHSHTHFCCFVNIIWYSFLNLPIYSSKVCILFGRWGVHLTIRTFWVQPNHHHPARIAISLLFDSIPVFQLKRCYQNSISSYTCGIPTNST